MDYRHFAVVRAKDVLTLQLNDPKLFDAATITALQDELIDLVDLEQPLKVIVDFSHVAHCSTAVINGLLRAKKRIAARDGKLMLCGMTNPIREAYKMLNLDGTVFQIHNTPEDAAKAF